MRREGKTEHHTPGVPELYAVPHCLLLGGVCCSGELSMTLWYQNPCRNPSRHRSLGAALSSADSTRAGSWLPWAWCNLRRNPFGELTRQERVELAVVDVDSIAGRLGNARSAVQLIGECGRGKTTRMLVLEQAIANATYVYLPEDQPCPAIPEGNPLLIDEAQRLPRRVRGRVFASGLPLVLATHRDLFRSLQRAGYQVHTELIGLANDASMICEFLNRRIKASRLERGPVPRLSHSDASVLAERFGTDLRGIEGYLYERVQTQVYSHGEMRFVD